MEVEYKNASIRKVCQNADEAEKKYGVRMAELIHQRIDEIRAMSTVEDLIKYRIGRCHALKGNRKTQYAMDLVHPQRLIFEKKETTIQIVRIIEIADYH